MAARWFRALLSLAALALFGLGLARNVRQLARDPELNWDMLPAMALALEWEEKDPEELHRRTYELARAELDAETYAQLTAPGVRAARAQDPQAFYEHLAFYRGRVLYSLAVRFVHERGVALSRATWLVPLGCYAMVAALVLGWAAAHLPLGVAALLALALSWTPGLLNVAVTSSADGLTLLFVCLGAWALLERGLFPVAAGLMTLAVGARPDTVILIGFLALALVLVPRRGEGPYWVGPVVWVAASAGAYIVLAAFAGEYGWWPLMRISFVEKEVHPSTLPTAVDWAEYFRILGRQFATLPGNGYVQTPAGEVTGSTAVLPWAGFALLALPLAWRQERRAAALLLALLATYVVRFLLFPQLWDRFFGAFYVLVPLALLNAAYPAPPRASVVRRRSVRRAAPTATTPSTTSATPAAPEEPPVAIE